ncbi:MAG TPA: L-ribulose-5-phosphate 4-epimerase AraD [Acidobacteriota bacterium]|nr:L-ribulose-5-phosphate 4-epimerase AraD [Acidobacteriota bacterium]
MKSYQTLKQEAWEANQQLNKLGLVMFTFGNVSAVDRDKGVIAIKPSGVPYEKLGVDDIVVVDLEGRVVDGSLRPSSDTPTHLVLYRHFHDIRGVAHTHSTFATAWAQAVRPIPILGTTHADLLPCDVPCTGVMADSEIGSDYEVQTGVKIVETFGKFSYREVPMVLVANHGPFTWGDSAADAVYHSALLEEIARMAYLTLQIKPDQPRLRQSLIDRHFRRKHGEDSYYGQDK